MSASVQDSFHSKRPSAHGDELTSGWSCLFGDGFKMLIDCTLGVGTKLYLAPEMVSSQTKGWQGRQNASASVLGMSEPPILCLTLYYS